MGEAFRDPIDSHKIEDRSWPDNSSMYRLEPPYEYGQVREYQYVIVAQTDMRHKGMAIIGCDKNGVPSWDVIATAATSDGSQDAMLAGIGYEDVYDEEFPGTV